MRVCKGNILICSSSVNALQGHAGHKMANPEGNIQQKIGLLTLCYVIGKELFGKMSYAIGGTIL